MSSKSRHRHWVTSGFGGALLVGLVTSVATASVAGASTPAPSAYVLSPKAAKSLGFPIVVRTAKKSEGNGAKGCSSAVNAYYMNSATQTGLISEVVNCNSATSASNALASVRKRFGADPAIPVPKSLGKAAFASSGQAPEYLIAWKAGNKVAYAVFDTDVPTSTATSTTAIPKPLTKSQEATLSAAALKQRAILLHLNG